MEVGGRDTGDIDMICEELEKLEGELDDIITELERSDLTLLEREELEATYAKLSQSITKHHKAGHQGGPCFEE